MRRAISSKNSPRTAPAASASAINSRNFAGSYSSRRAISAAHSRSNTRPTAPIPRAWADFVWAVESRARHDRFAAPHRLEVHREVMAVTRRLGETAPRVAQAYRKRVARNQPAAAAAPFRQQSVAAQQRAIADHQQSVVVPISHLHFHWLNRSEDPRAVKT